MLEIGPELANVFKLAIIWVGLCTCLYFYLGGTK